MLFFHDMESDGVCSTDFHDCEVQVYVEKVENSVRGLSRSVKRGAYCISRNMLGLVVHFGPWAFNGLSIELRSRAEDQTRCALTQCQLQLFGRAQRQDLGAGGPAGAQGCGTRGHHWAAGKGGSGVPMQRLDAIGSHGARWSAPQDVPTHSSRARGAWKRPGRAARAAKHDRQRVDGAPILALCSRRGTTQSILSRFC